MTPAWLTVTRGEAPLLVSCRTPARFGRLGKSCDSPWLARRDCDWWIDKLYGFAAKLGATIVHTAISRTVIDVNRDPSGVSLYPGQATTTLCPTDTFDGDPIYKAGQEPMPMRSQRGVPRTSIHITRR
jgi:formiminoglutamase